MLLTIVLSLVSGIAGSVLTIYFQSRAEKRQLKIDTLRQFVGYRHDLTGEQFTKALNEIFVIFQDSEPVLDRLNDFHEVIVSGQKKTANNKLLSLFKEMCSDLRIDTSKYNDDLFLKSFNGK